MSINDPMQLVKQSFLPE